MNPSESTQIPSGSLSDRHWDTLPRTSVVALGLHLFLYVTFVPRPWDRNTWEMGDRDEKGYPSTYPRHTGRLYLFWKD